MENIINLIDKLKVDEDLLKCCKVQLLSCEDIASLKINSSWLLELKINIEYDLNYDKLYHGSWNNVPEKRRRMFQVLSFLKAYCIVKNPKKNNIENLQKALHVLDVAIITGTGLNNSYLLTEFAQLLHEFLGKFIIIFIVFVSDQIFILSKQFQTIHLIKLKCLL